MLLALPQRLIKKLFDSMSQDAAARSAAILGIADGLTIVIALICGRNSAIFHPALDAGIGEFCGMAAALYLSASGAGRRLVPAFLCGLATLFGCVLPAIPYALVAADIARPISAAIAIGLAALVCKLRPEKGAIAVIETYGVLLAAGVLCFLVSLL